MEFLDTLIGREATIKTQRSLFNNHIRNILPLTDSYDISFVSRAIITWQDKGLSAGTIRGLAYLLFKYIHWKTGKDIYDRRIIGVINRMKQQAPPSIWTEEEVKKALQYAQYTDAELYSMLIFTLATGCRKGEMMAVTWEDIDFIKGMVTICRGLREGMTKSGKSRIIPMNKQLEKVLTGMYTVGKEEFHRVFLVSDPNPRLHQLCKETGVSLISWHSLRHTFATRALEAGVSPKKVAYLMGNSVKTLLDTYWNVGTINDLDLNFMIPTNEV